MSGLGTCDGVRFYPDGGAQPVRFVACVGALKPVPGGEPEEVGIGDEKIEEAAGIAGQILGSEGHLVEDPSDIGVHHGVEKPILVAEVRVDKRPVRVRRGFDAVDAGSGDPVGSELGGCGPQEASLGGFGVADLGDLTGADMTASVPYNCLFV